MRDDQYEKLKIELENILNKIFVDKYPYNRVRTARKDYNRDVYSLPEWATTYKDIRIYFLPNVRRDSLANRDQDTYNCKYSLMLGDKRGDAIIAHLERRPRKEFVFVDKPYQNMDLFIYNLIYKILSYVSPETEIKYQNGENYAK